jgi:hypothetical protein
MRQDDYWIGCTRRTGPLIYDPTLQEGCWSARVRLWDVEQGKVVEYYKREIKRDLVSLRAQSHSYEDEERLTSELRRAIADYRKWLNGRKVTHCYRCRHHLDSLAEQPCAECGWLRCRCGACGCSYLRGR